MCDTMVCLPSVTKSGRMIFGKNSDRSPNEPHIIERIPSKDYDLSINSKVKTTYIEIDQVEHTYAVTLFKPSWIWGAEMGFNEHGLNIGNEAVFTKVKRGKDALLGMDLLRLALERSKTAYDALLTITDLLDKYGQGGNCGYQKKFYYDNSFLIADRKEAYVLETAGSLWAAVKVKDVYAISNGLTIEGDFDFAHPQIIKERNEIKNYSFKKKYKEPIFTFFAESLGRRCTAETMLKSQAGSITLETVIETLRSHKPNTTNKGSVGSVCMHAGGLIGDHTTGSYVAEISEDSEIYLATGASLPCMSVFKPLTREKIEGDCSDRGLEYWYRRELLNRYFLAGQADLDSFKKERDKLEIKYVDKFIHSKGKAREEVVVKCAVEEQKLIDKYLEPLKNTQHCFELGSRSYRKYWTKKTEKLKEDYNK